MSRRALKAYLLALRFWWIPFGLGFIIVAFATVSEIKPIFAVGLLITLFGKILWIIARARASKKNERAEVAALYAEQVSRHWPLTPSPDTSTTNSAGEQRSA